MLLEKADQQTSSRVRRRIELLTCYQASWLLILMASNLLAMASNLVASC